MTPSADDCICFCFQHTVSTEYCIPDRTDADGSFSVEEVTPGPKRLITYGETAMSGLVASVAFSFDADQTPNFVPEGLDLVDLFVLHPILSTLDPPAPLSFPSDTGLAPETRVNFHTLDYETGQLVEVASGTVDTQTTLRRHSDDTNNANATSAAMDL